MPWPCKFENVLSGIDITISNIPTERTHMRTNRQTLLHDFTALVAFLRGEAWVHSYHVMTSSLSLVFKDIEECAPTSVHDALCQRLILHHVENSKLLNRNHLIAFSILLSCFIVMVPTLTGNLQMGLCRATSSLTTAMRTFLTACYGSLLASQRSLRGAIETRILNRMTLAIGEETQESHINTDSGMLACGWFVFGLGFRLADDQGIPVSIGTMDEMNGFRSSLNRAVQLDLERPAQLSRNMHMFVIRIQPYITASAVLPELNGMPAIRLLETGEARIRDAQLFRSKIPFERLHKSISKHLHGGGRHMFTSTTLELCSQIVLRWECAILLILCLKRSQHLIIELARLGQASHKQAGLFLIHKQAILKRSHAPNCDRVGYKSQQFRPPVGGWPF